MSHQSNFTVVLCFLVICFYVFPNVNAKSSNYEKNYKLISVDVNKGIDISNCGNTSNPCYSISFAVTHICNIKNSDPNDQLQKTDDMMITEKGENTNDDDENKNNEYNGCEIKILPGNYYANQNNITLNARIDVSNKNIDFTGEIIKNETKSVIIDLQFLESTFIYSNIASNISLKNIIIQNSLISFSSSQNKTMNYKEEEEEEEEEEDDEEFYSVLYFDFTNTNISKSENLFYSIDLENVQMRNCIFGGDEENSDSSFSSLITLISTSSYKIRDQFSQPLFSTSKSSADAPITPISVSYDLLNDIFDTQKTNKKKTNVKVQIMNCDFRDNYLRAFNFMMIENLLLINSTISNSTHFFQSSLFLISSSSSSSLNSSFALIENCNFINNEIILNPSPSSSFSYTKSSIKFEINQKFEIIANLISFGDYPSILLINNTKFQDNSLSILPHSRTPHPSTSKKISFIYFENYDLIVESSILSNNSINCEFMETNYDNNDKIEVNLITPLISNSSFLLSMKISNCEFNENFLSFADTYILGQYITNFETYLLFVDSNSFNVSIENSEFSFNYANSIYLTNPRFFHFNDLNFTQNLKTCLFLLITRDYIYYDDPLLSIDAANDDDTQLPSSNFTISNSSFTRNQIDDFLIFYENFDISFVSILTLFNSMNTESKMIPINIENCIFSQNYASAISVEDYWNLNLKNSIIEGNYLNGGAAVYCDFSMITLFNSDIDSNFIIPGEKKKRNLEYDPYQVVESNYRCGTSCNILNNESGVQYCDSNNNDAFYLLFLLFFIAAISAVLVLIFFVVAYFIYKKRKLANEEDRVYNQLDIDDIDDINLVGDIDEKNKDKEDEVYNHVDIDDIDE